MSQQVRIRSRWWYLLPIFFGIIGGVIAYFILRDDDPKKAKNCLWLGIVLIAIKFGFFVVFMSMCFSMGPPCAEFFDEFMKQNDSIQHPQQMQQMMQDPEFREQMMDQMMQNPEFMDELMQSPEFMQRMNP